MQISINYGEKTYILEYTRSSVQTMERTGFRITDVEDKPVTMIPMFFAGAFQAHHPNVSRKIIENIYSSLKDKDKLLEALLDMFSETITSLMAEPDEDSKNSEWAIVG